jgi:ribonuclease VapC
MVVDTSALVSIEKEEHDALHFENEIIGAKRVFLSAVSYLELSQVTIGKGDRSAVHRIDALLRNLSIEIVDVTIEDALLAREAFIRYGKGRDRAQLNLGDCFSYALAQRLGEPLLFKGNDFIHTDVLKA